ncbi:hypothetical protein [Candidatus Xianfuyuplasma coldseepsis]|uniref:Uncharacterized protein n=1 Tax=Candidatus Xianfuyuplasma coldseepsis TaxID=2782163 RepID=A0A7L7KTK5_9MOLU|nr:hypothetical protein [Xianfuyuplasma coldseepsis]QMS85108.1 hypothetical protein G4Z02_04905 [Xianfuyuplasma coldseepsis]
MAEYKNKSADIKIQYCIEQYDRLETLFKLDFHEFALLLSLMGFLHGEKLPINANDNNNKEHTFSRTTYDRAETDFDAYFGLLTILDNQALGYDEVINNIAFEKTSQNNVSFPKLTNVSTFYGYLISGIEKTFDEFYKYGNKSYDVASAIHDFLNTDINSEMLIIDELLLVELEEEDNEV